VPLAWWDQHSESLHALHDFTRRSVGWRLATHMGQTNECAVPIGTDTECCSIGRLTRSNQLKLSVLRRNLAQISMNLVG